MRKSECGNAISYLHIPAYFTIMKIDSDERAVRKQGCTLLRIEQR